MDPSTCPGSGSLTPILTLGKCCKVHLLRVGSSVLLGNIQAVALRDIFVQAQNRDSLPPSLQIDEPEWERRRSINLSELIDIYRWAAVWPCHRETESLSGWAGDTWADVCGGNSAGLHIPPSDLVKGSYKGSSLGDVKH